MSQSGLPPSVEAMMAADRCSPWLGITVESAGDGQAVARMRVRPEMINGHDVAHGGLIFALADTAFAAACNGTEIPTVAAGAEIVFARPARAGDELLAHAALRTRFGRTGIYDVTVRRGDEVIAEFRGRSAEVRGG